MKTDSDVFALLVYRASRNSLWMQLECLWMKTDADARVDAVALLDPSGASPNSLWMQLECRSKLSDLIFPRIMSFLISMNEK